MRSWNSLTSLEEPCMPLHSEELSVTLKPPERIHGRGKKSFSSFIYRSINESEGEGEFRMQTTEHDKDIESATISFNTIKDVIIPPYYRTPPLGSSA